MFLDFYKSGHIVLISKLFLISKTVTSYKLTSQNYINIVNLSIVDKKHIEKKIIPHISGRRAARGQERQKDSINVVSEKSKWPFEPDFTKKKLYFLRQNN